MPKVRNWCRFIEGCNDQNVLDRAETDYNNEIMLAAKKAKDETMLSMARRMLSAGKYDITEIPEMTGRSVEDVRSLQGV